MFPSQENVFITSRIHWRFLISAPVTLVRTFKGIETDIGTVNRRYTFILYVTIMATILQSAIWQSESFLCYGKQHTAKWNL